MMFNLLLKLYLSKITILIKLQQCLIKETIRWVYTKLHLMAEGSDPIICTEQKLIWSKHPYHWELLKILEITTRENLSLPVLIFSPVVFILHLY
jgi:hypothetical protein